MSHKLSWNSTLLPACPYASHWWAFICDMEKGNKQHYNIAQRRIQTYRIYLRFFQSNIFWRAESCNFFLAPVLMTIFILFCVWRQHIKKSMCELMKMNSVFFLHRIHILVRLPVPMCLARKNAACTIKTIRN